MNTQESESLIRVSKKTLMTDQVPQVREITVKFGKNGHGLTSELTEIGRLIEEESCHGEVYLEDSFIDALDDVYELRFKVHFKA